MKNFKITELNGTLEMLCEDELYSFKGGLSGGQSEGEADKIIDIEEVIIDGDKPDFPDWDPESQWGKEPWDHDDNDHLPPDHFPDNGSDGGGTGSGDGGGNELVIDTGNEAINREVENLLKCNTPLSKLIKELTDNGAHVKIGIENLGDLVQGGRNHLGKTIVNGDGSFTINFNTNAFSDGKYVFDSIGRSEIGTDYSELNPWQEFGVVLGHELLHVKYGQIMNDAVNYVNKNNLSLNDIPSFLSSRGYQGLIDVYMQNINGNYQWKDVSSTEGNKAFNTHIHDYMRTQDGHTLDAISHGCNP
ncbi:hypothetical protein [Chryseobacterium artocarpi]|uniref:hypothetical protein n=1 Tax=Chryseobacterium artocarpi TaxID=1414727 RepID=UPI003F3F0425